MKHVTHGVEVWEEDIIIPTYEVGAPDANPMFFEKRVYQGSSGKVYPLPVIDKIFDEKVNKSYRAVWLENDYLRVMLLPELGGRVQRALDKTNGYDFVYYNEVIKPALVGLTGPWISGGIEFNWPQHHRPSTFSPTDFLLEDNEDGSKTVRVSEIDRMYGTKGMACFTLYPDRAYLEIKGQLYNRTYLPQTFLWWANPAVPVNDHTQSIFPPDVHAVMDHGKRAVSSFPIAKGVYYKHDYSSGVDISRYQNIPVPTSYMAFHSDADFVGGYDEQKEAGILHVADHHISPGKKQWTWGCGDFGQAWDRNLTDENGPYIELMTGVFTDNQPDFTWLMPFEEKTFTQVFMPYKKVGAVKNANTEIVLGLEVGDKVELRVYSTRAREAIIRLTCGENTLFETQCNLSPEKALCQSVRFVECAPEELTLSVWDENHQLLLSYSPQKGASEKAPESARPAESPEGIATVEELLYTALHLEQYRHATFAPEPYYLEGLKRDPKNSGLNNAYGLLLMRRGLFSEAEACFRLAIERLTQRNPNPPDGEAFLNLGLSLTYQERYDDAFDAYYKATWCGAQQEAGFYGLAAIACRRGDFPEALVFVERSLIRNAHNIKARGLKGLLLQKLNRLEEATQWLLSNLEIDPFDYLSRFLLGKEARVELLGLMSGDPHSYLNIARDFAWWGRYSEALDALSLCDAKYPLLWYYRAAFQFKLDMDSSDALISAAVSNPDYCFPNELEDIAVLRFAMRRHTKDAKAPYYLGNLMYDRKRYDEAAALWNQSVEIDPTFPTAHRNLSLAYYNKQNRPSDALRELRAAYELNPSDARVLLELDQLHKRIGRCPQERFDFLSAHRDTVFLRDDLTTEYITLLNRLNRPQEAYQLIMNRRFHPWEGGEGKITAQYTLSLILLALAELRSKRYAQAEERLQAALTFPPHLGEGKLEGARDNHVYYYLGCVCEAAGRQRDAAAFWEKAILGDCEPAGMMYYNDQPADMIFYQAMAYQKLGRGEEAVKRYEKLVAYGERHIDDEMKIEYFAVSLPDLQIFEDDLTARNRAHCLYLLSLGRFGRGDRKGALAAYSEMLTLDNANLWAPACQDYAE